jgi:trans-aconitate methyltransferase
MTEAPFPSPVIREDFDRLAQFDADAWSHNSHYHAYLLRHVPPRCADSLDVGCGAGAFTRLLGQR